MTCGRNSSLLESIQDELALLKEQVDVIESKFASKERMGPRCSSAMGYLSCYKNGNETPLSTPVVEAASNNITSPWGPARGRVFIASKSRIPKSSQPSRPSSAMDVAPLRISTRPKATSKAGSNSGQSLLPVPKPSNRRSMNEPLSMHSSVSSLMSAGSGHVPRNRSSTRHGSLLDGQHDRTFSAKKQFALECSIPPSEIPQFSHVRPMSAMGCFDMPKDRDVHKHPGSSCSKRSNVKQAPFKASFSPGKHKQTPYSRAMSPCVHMSLANFDVGRL